MNVKKTAQKQYQARIDKTAKEPAYRLNAPHEGWITTLRKALGMSAAQLGRLSGRSRASIAAIERNELKNSATLKSMDAMAEAMGCKFVYAIVPSTGAIEDVLEAQAFKKARSILERTATHMALEKQSLSKSAQDEQLTELASDLLRNPPPDFWEV